MKNVFLNVEHLRDSFIVNKFDDTWVIQISAKEHLVDVSPLITYSFDVQRYEEAGQFTGLEDCPDTVAKVFLDYTEVSKILPTVPTLSIWVAVSRSDSSCPIVSFLTIYFHFQEIFCCKICCKFKF